MGKAKVKKILNKEEKKNLFDLRFNHVKHKVINQKLQKSEYGSNPYQSRNRANEIRKKTLLVDYKNRNKNGFIKYVDKSKQQLKNDNDIKLKQQQKQKLDDDNSKKSKKKDNSQYMSEMFEKKRQSQIEKDKMHDLRDNLDDKWKLLKNDFLKKELARKELNVSNKIDSYDLIFNDLIVNPTQRYVPKT